MAKEKLVLSIDDLQRRLFALERTYGSGALVEVDEDLNFTPYNRPDLAEETPEESAKTAERQRKEALERAQNADDRAARLTRPIEAITTELQKADAPVKRAPAKE